MDIFWHLARAAPARAITRNCFARDKLRIKGIAFGDNFNVLFGDNLRRFVGLIVLPKLGFFETVNIRNRVVELCSFVPEIFRNEWRQHNVYICKMKTLSYI